MARSLTHQSGSLVASIRYETARSSRVRFRISIAVRRSSSSLSLTSSSTASTTRGPPILPSASAARLRTHQSASLIASSRNFTESAVPISLRTSTAERRAYSDSSCRTLTRYLTVCGLRTRISTSTARFCTSMSLSASALTTGSISAIRSNLARAARTAWRMNLLGSLIWAVIARSTAGVWKRARISSMWRRTTGSLPSTLAIRSGIEPSSATSPTIL